MTIIINISGPPASGKSFLCKTLLSWSRKRNVRWFYTSISGFHYLSYTYAILLLNLNYLGGIERGVIYKHLKVYRRNPYDLISTCFLKKHLHIIYVLEVMSIFMKLLIIKLKMFLRRPKIVLIDEGIINMMFSYVIFFFTRKSTLWKKMLQFVLTFFYALCSKSNCLTVVLMPNINVEVNSWIKRGDFPGLHVARSHVDAYRRIVGVLLRITYCLTNTEAYMFSSNVEAFKFITRYLKDYL